jgi:hypothetical protein
MMTKENAAHKERSGAKRALNCLCTRFSATYQKGAEAA